MLRMGCCPLSVATRLCPHHLGAVSNRCISQWSPSPVSCGCGLRVSGCSCLPVALPTAPDWEKPTLTCWVVCCLPGRSLALVLASTRQVGQSSQVPHQWLCHLLAGLETSALGAAFKVNPQLGTVSGLGGTSSPLHQGWGCAGFASVAERGARGIPGGWCWPWPVPLNSLHTEISYQHQREAGEKKKRSRDFVYLNQK